MFGSLTEKIGSVLDRLRGKGKIRKEDLDEASRQIKMNLLEADVHFKVVQNFIKAVSERLTGVDQLPTLSVQQYFVGILHEEMVKMLGVAPELDFQTVLMVGLQGSGKTTSSVKLANWIRKNQQRHPVLVPADTQRPAAIEQLKVLAKKNNFNVFDTQPNMRAIDACREALQNRTSEPLIVDSAGRLQIDDALMGELQEIQKLIKPTCTLLVVDAMTGQEAVKVAEAFHQKTPINGVILTKMDGDARGGAALSIRTLTGIPIAFFGVGEAADHLEAFSADRIASRLLGMGDITGILEKVQDAAQIGMASESAIDKGNPDDVEGFGNFKNFGLEDFLKALKWLKRLGPLEGVLRMMPGFSKVSKGLDLADSEQSMRQMQAMIQSMTRSERQDPTILNGSRRKRIALGSGTKVEELNRFIKHYEMMRKMMKQMGGMRQGRGLKPF